MESNIAKPIYGYVNLTLTKDGNSKILTDETIKLHNGVVMNAENGYSITVKGGQTANLGNYESARIDVAITIPCTKDTIEEAYEWGSEWVSEKIDEAMKPLKG